MKLVVFLEDEKRKEQVETQENPIEFSLEEFKLWTPKDLEVYGRVWAQVWPSDIVMLVEG